MLVMREGDAEGEEERVEVAEDGMVDDGIVDDMPPRQGRMLSVAAFSKASLIFW